MSMYEQDPKTRAGCRFVILIAISMHLLCLGGVLPLSSLFILMDKDDDSTSDTG